MNYAWSAWGEYGDCSVSCGGDGTQERFRYCNPPKKGGFPCPSQMDSSTRTCNNGPCPGTYHFLKYFQGSRKIVLGSMKNYYFVASYEMLNSKWWME